MTRNNESLEETVAALRDLVQLLQLSHDAALQLKQHVPSPDFPTAYKLAKKLQILQAAVDEMQHRVDPQVGTLPTTTPPQDIISSSDRL